MNKKITLIIPIRITDQVYEAEERLRRLLYTIPKDKYDILIVDYGSADKYQHIFKEVQSAFIEIIHIDAKDKPFNLGLTRDTGVQYAKNEVVLLNDIDFYANTFMYERIYAEASARDLWKNTYNFFCVPAFFLTETGTEYYLSNLEHNDCFNLKIQHKICEKRDSLVHFPAYGSSAIVVNKYNYLSLGGHNKAFYGHGAEDFELLHRLTYYYPKGPRTARYYDDTKSNDIDEYVGFRAYFALYGIDLYHKGIFIVHLWHPTRKSIEGYYRSRINFNLCKNLMMEFDSEKKNPLPLEDKTQITKSLLIVKEYDSSPVRAIKQLLPRLGSYEILEESIFKDAEDIQNFCKKMQYDSVGFLNPYGNSHRLSLYKALKKINYRLWVFDRGALPNSWFFDEGFNYDSPSYDINKWDNPVSEEDEKSISLYIRNLRYGDATLEANGARTSAAYLKELFNVGRRKVLFIALQRPNDTVVNFFSGKATNFYNWIDYIASKLDPKEWLVLCKKHPLEKQLPELSNVIFTNHNTHIHGLLELADKVFVLNSGVGLLGLAFDKHVICAGQSFYAAPGLATMVNSEKEALNAILSDYMPDPDKVLRFYNHLINKIYSFGESKEKEIVNEDGTSSKIVTEIFFENIKILGKQYTFGSVFNGVSLDAPLFYSFGGRKGIKNIPSQTQLKANTIEKSPLPRSRFNRLLRKLLRDPHAYFADSSHAFLRKFKNLFPKKTK